MARPPAYLEVVDQRFEGGSWITTFRLSRFWWLHLSFWIDLFNGWGDD